MTVNIAVAVAGVSSVGDQHRIPTRGGVNAGLNGGVGGGKDIERGGKGRNAEASGENGGGAEQAKQGMEVQCGYSFDGEIRKMRKLA